MVGGAAPPFTAKTNVQSALSMVKAIIADRPFSLRFMDKESLHVIISYTGSGRLS